MNKKGLALLLSVSMVVTSLTTPVFAENGEVSEKLATEQVLVDDAAEYSEVVEIIDKKIITDETEELLKKLLRI